MFVYLVNILLVKVHDEADVALQIRWLQADQLCL